MILSETVRTNLAKVKEDTSISTMLDRINSCGTAVILGGAIRDWHVGKQPRDIDIVVDSPAPQLKFLLEYGAQKNNFGGYKLIINKTEFDIWNLESTWALKNDAKFAKKLDVIPETVFLNLDAVQYYISTGEVLDKGFGKAMENRILDIVYEPNPYPYLCVSKSLVALHKYDMKPSQRLKDFIRAQEGRGYCEVNFTKYQNVSYGSLVFNYKECMSRVV